MAAVSARKPRHRSCNVYAMPVNVTSSVHFRPGGGGASAFPALLAIASAWPAVTVSAAGGLRTITHGDQLLPSDTGPWAIQGTAKGSETLGSPDRPVPRVLAVRHPGRVQLRHGVAGERERRQPGRPQ